MTTYEQDMKNMAAIDTFHNNGPVKMKNPILIFVILILSGFGAFAQPIAPDMTIPGSRFLPMQISYNNKTETVNTVDEYGSLLRKIAQAMIERTRGNEPPEPLQIDVKKDGKAKTLYLTAIDLGGFKGQKYQLVDNLISKEMSK